MSRFFQQFTKSPLHYIVGFLQSLTRGNVLFRVLHKPLGPFDCYLDSGKTMAVIVRDGQKIPFPDPKSKSLSALRPASLWIRFCLAHSGLVWMP